MKLWTKLMALVAVLALSSAAMAWGPSLVIGGFLGGFVSDVLPVQEIGSALYGIQEGVHNLFTGLTGIAIPHDYINVCTADECLKIDPPRFGN